MTGLLNSPDSWKPASLLGTLAPPTGPGGRHNYITPIPIVFCQDSLQGGDPHLLTLPLLPFPISSSKEMPRFVATRTFLAKCLLAVAPELDIYITEQRTI